VGIVVSMQNESVMMIPLLFHRHHHHHHHQQQTTMFSSDDPSSVQRLALELESLRAVPKHDGKAFPNCAKSLLLSLPGNDRCVDCGNLNPEWASVTYGALLCVRCSGRHRSYGVATSRVRSISMDAWSQSQVLALLEGGNEQLQHFFERHQMGNDSPKSSQRYHTKAALFYRTNLDKHVHKVGGSGMYKGRQASRERTQKQECRSPEEATTATCHVNKLPRREHNIVVAA
jgi:hypothetical protein